MKSPEAMASGRGVINLRFNQDQGLLHGRNVKTLQLMFVFGNKIIPGWLSFLIIVSDCFRPR